MQGYVDARSLVVTEYEDVYDESTLQSVTVLSLPGGSMVELDEITEKINQELSVVYQSETQTGIYGHVVKDTRQIVAVGASAASQEVILALAASLVGGAAQVLLQNLSSWCVQKLKEKKFMYTALDTSIDGAKRLVTKHFNPQGQLEVVSMSNSQENLKFVLADSEGNQYQVESVKGNPVSLRINKTRNSV
jgi:hypothetical protein